MIAGLLMLAGGAAAGLFGALLGLGGGILIVPLLTIGFGRPLREAVAISLVCVIVTSSAAAGTYLQARVANLRLGMVLELFTAMGALIGGLIAFAIDERVLAGLFTLLLVYVIVSMLRRGRGGRDAAETTEPVSPDDHSFAASLAGPGYRIRNLGRGAFAAIGAGIVSALLGIGGGLVKVPVMHLVMGVPLRTATATSNLMIGITATASAVIYILRGEVDPYIAGPLALGVFAGATIGSRTAHRIDLHVLRWLFVIVLTYTAYEMVRKALAI